MYMYVSSIIPVVSKANVQFPGEHLGGRPDRLMQVPFPLLQRPLNWSMNWSIDDLIYGASVFFHDPRRHGL